MTRDELRQRCDEKGLIEGFVWWGVGSEPVRDHFGIECRGDEWAVFYSERGIRSDEFSFDLEEDVVGYLLNELRREPQAFRDGLP